jgi:DNA-binding response OmpR family regulator
VIACAGDSLMRPIPAHLRAIEAERPGDRLTLLEAMLLKLLVERRGQVVTKAEILEKVWNLNPETETRAVDNFVMRLRRHLEEDARSPRLLQTVRGVGYRLTED